MWAKFWLWVKTYLFKFLGGLFMDEKDGAQVISLGRVLLIAVFGTMMWFWHHEKPELPGGLMETFYALLGYVFGSKAVQTAQQWVNTKGPTLGGGSPKTPEEP